MTKEKEIDFLDNKFSIHLLQEFGKSTRGFQHRNGYKHGENNHHLLTKTEQYQAAVFKIQGQIASTTEQIKMIKIFILRYPLKNYYLEKGISQLDFIQYHTEVLSFKVHTILEIMRLMVNKVYGLKIKERDCSWSTLSKKLNQTVLPMRILDAYFKTFKNMIELRHLSSHQGIYNDKAKDKIDIDFCYFLYKQAAKTDYEVPDQLKQAFPLPYVEWEIKRYKKDRIKLIDKILINNAKLLRDFFESLLPEYLKSIGNTN